MPVTRPNRAAAVAAVLAAVLVVINVVVMAGATIALEGAGCGDIAAHATLDRAGPNRPGPDRAACARLSRHPGPDTASGPTSAPTVPMTTPHSAGALTRAMARPASSTPAPTTPATPTTGTRR